MIEEAFSARTIIPGKTTTDDIVWWFRDKMEEVCPVLCISSRIFRS